LVFAWFFINYLDIFFLFNEKGKSFANISIKKQRRLDSDSRPRPEVSPSQALQLGLAGSVVIMLLNVICLRAKKFEFKIYLNNLDRKNF
jgi:hypothetical protein